MRLKLPQDEYVERATYRATYRQGQTTPDRYVDGKRQRQKQTETERELGRGRAGQGRHMGAGLVAACNGVRSRDVTLNRPRLSLNIPCL